MTTTAADLLRRALKLPLEARAALASSLIESLDESTDPEAESAWRQEIQKRAREIDAGRVRPIPWTQVKKALRRA